MKRELCHNEDMTETELDAPRDEIQSGKPSPVRRVWVGVGHALGEHMPRGHERLIIARYEQFHRMTDRLGGRAKKIGDLLKGPVYKAAYPVGIAHTAMEGVVAGAAAVGAYIIAEQEFPGIKDQRTRIATQISHLLHKPQRAENLIVVKAVDSPVKPPGRAFDTRVAAPRNLGFQRAHKLVRSPRSSPRGNLEAQAHRILMPKSLSDLGFGDRLGLDHELRGRFDSLFPVRADSDLSLDEMEQTFQAHEAAFRDFFTSWTEALQHRKDPSVAPLVDQAKAAVDPDAAQGLWRQVMGKLFDMSHPDETYRGDFDAQKSRFIDLWQRLEPMVPVGRPRKK